MNNQPVLNKQAAAPLYLQLKKLIEGQIADGTLGVHSRLPSERELSTRFGISRMTVRQALAELLQEGRLYTSVGKGTFVAAPKFHQNLRSLSSFTEDMVARGRVPMTRLMARAIVPAGVRVASSLNIAAGSHVICVERLRLVDGEPLALETAFLAFDGAERLLMLDLEGSLYALLKAEFGLVPSEALQDLEAVLAQPRERSLLNLSEGTPVLRIRRTTFEGAGRAFEYVESVYRGDRYCFVARLIRDDRL